MIHHCRIYSLYTTLYYIITLHYYITPYTVWTISRCTVENCTISIDWAENNYSHIFFLSFLIPPALSSTKGPGFTPSKQIEPTGYNITYTLQYVTFLLNSDFSDVFFERLRNAAHDYTLLL